MIPRKNVDLPAIIVELKYGERAEIAINQIKQRQYSDKVNDFAGDLLLFGISYDKKEKKHSCVIEKQPKR